MTAATDVALVLAPPFIPDEPHLGLACLYAYLESHRFSVSIHDLSIRLFHDTTEEEHHHWERSSSSAEFWQRIPQVEAFFERHRTTLERYLDDLLAEEPQVVGFSCHMSNSLITIKLLQLLREKGPEDLVIVAGGPAFFTRETGEGIRPCMFGHTVLDSVDRRSVLDGWLKMLDGIVLDEGESPLLEICTRVREGRDLDGVPNTFRVLDLKRYAPLRRVPPIQDLSSIPFPSFDGFDLKRYLRGQLPTLFNRGCIKRCTCCTERTRWGKFRARKAEHIVAELKHHIDRYGIRHFAAYDMLINANVRELGRLCDLIIHEGLEVHWCGNAIVRKEMTEEMFLKMKAAGCSSLIFGIESGSPRIVKLINKGFTLDVGEQNLAACHRAGIKTCINIIIGFPGETEEDFQQSIDYVRRNRDSIDWIILLAMFEIFHHTEIAENPEKYHLRPEDVEGLDETFGLVDWSDTTGNTYEVRQHRFARMVQVLAELGLPHPTMQGDDLRRAQMWEIMLGHHAIHAMMESALEIDPALDIPLDEILIGLLQSDDPKKRVGAARMLGMIGSRKALPTLHEALQDPHEWVRGEAARAVGRIGHPASIRYLEEMLGDEVYPTLSEEMRQGLWKLRRLYEARQKEAALAAAVKPASGGDAD